jgi:uncharacterized protein (TIGR02145 family)
MYPRLTIGRGKIMKTLILIPVFLFSNLCPIQAQSDVQTPKKLFKTWISIQGKKDKVAGVLYEIRDSSILLSGSYEKADYIKGNNLNLKKIEVADINSINVRRHKAIGRGIMVGSLSGVGLGVIMGLATTTPGGDDKEQGTTKLGASIFFSIFLGACGTVIGAGVGAIKSKIVVHGSQQQFENKKVKLIKRSVTYDPLMAGQKLTTFSHLRDTVVDVDGNVYHVVALGAMVYLAENLKATHFRNGQIIQKVNDTAAWRKTSGAAYCNFRNDSAGGAVYGRLYNGFALTDTAGLCPPGWHVPNQGEWTSLIMCLGGNDRAGGYLKESGNVHWGKPNYTMLTENTFALPSGSRDHKGLFSIPGQTCQWWVAIENKADVFQGILLTNETTGITMTRPDSHSGLSVRCMRDY